MQNGRSFAWSWDWLRLGLLRAHLFYSLLDKCIREAAGNTGKMGRTGHCSGPSRLCGMGGANSILTSLKLCWFDCVL
jgi:hypothetical protein